MAALILPDVFTPSTLSVAAVILIVYTITCYFFRFRARENLHQRFNYPTRASLAKMTNDDAQFIISWLAGEALPRLSPRLLRINIHL